MEWMLDIQLGRRNLSPIQRIAVAEKYRPIYEKQARLNQMSGLKQNQQNTVLQNSSKRQVCLLIHIQRVKKFSTQIMKNLNKKYCLEKKY